MIFGCFAWLTCKACGFDRLVNGAVKCSVYNWKDSWGYPALLPDIHGFLAPDPHSKPIFMTAIWGKCRVVDDAPCVSFVTVIGKYQTNLVPLPHSHQAKTSASILCRATVPHLEPSYPPALRTMKNRWLSQNSGRFFVLLKADQNCAQKHTLQHPAPKFAYCSTIGKWETTTLTIVGEKATATMTIVVEERSGQ